MLVCRACNTRYAVGMRACPSCGRKSSSNSLDSGSGDSSSGRLPPSAAAEPSRPKAKSQIELEENAVVEDGGSSAPRGRAKPGAAAGAIDTSLDQVRALLAEQPGLLEKGLGLYASDQGEPLGIDFATPVGSIDLLCRDRKGGFVVVHLPAPDEVSDSVSAMLRRMGWVRKHLAEGGDDVRGVVVLEQLPEDLAYAAAGAAGAISFKGYRLALTFQDLEE